MNIKRFKRNHPIIFWIVLILLIGTGIIALVGIAVFIGIVISKFNRAKIEEKIRYKFIEFDGESLEAVLQQHQQHQVILIQRLTKFGLTLKKGNIQ